MYVCVYVYKTDEICFRHLGKHLSTTSYQLFQDESTGEITFYMKGADVVMSGIVQYNDWLEEEVSSVFLAST